VYHRTEIGTYYQMSTKHLPAYLDEIAFRFNNRDNASSSRHPSADDHGETLSYAELVAEES
jgi:ISXO2-like transposase domain